VVAPGTHVTGAQPQVGADYTGDGTCDPQFPAGSTLYSLVSGTSQAAPEVTGAAALIRDYYSRTHGGTPPSPALTKAILVNTATDEVGGDDGDGGANRNVPTEVQGWGRIDIKSALDSTPRQYVDQDHRLTATGQTDRHVYSVADPGRPVKISLAFTDAPGPTSGDAFVNDLDLVVHAGGHTYLGNVLADGVSTTGGHADPRDNVENVFLPAGVSGPVTVDVVAKNIAGDGVPGNADPTDQDYALVVSDAVVAHGPNLVGARTTAAEGGGSDGDGAIEPGERFTLSERLRNVGNAPAKSITSTLSAAASGISITQPASTFPNIPADGVATQDTPFEGRLTSQFQCGADAALTLDVSTADGSFSVPVSFPTGRVGSPVQVDSTDVPKPIPDLGTATSRVRMPPSGKLADIDVRIGSIVHSFDADLRITLIAPDSTEVVLSNREGGSGQDYTNTVFDDQASKPIAVGNAPFTGSFRPESPLSALDGIDPGGIWKLKVEDLAKEDSGHLDAWGLTASVPSCD
jgi:subtilisin-like proprotein convertase family protein